MTVSPASQRRINRAVNQWIKAREAEKRRESLLKDAPPYGAHKTPDGRTVVRLAPDLAKFVRDAGLDPVAYAYAAIRDIEAGILPPDFLSQPPQDVQRGAAKRKRGRPSKNPLAGTTWTARKDATGMFTMVKTKAKPFRGRRSER